MNAPTVVVLLLLSGPRAYGPDGAHADVRVADAAAVRRAPAPVLGSRPPRHDPHRLPGRGCVRTAWLEDDDEEDGGPAGAAVFTRTVHVPAPPARLPRCLAFADAPGSPAFAGFLSPLRC